MIRLYFLLYFILPFTHSFSQQELQFVAGKNDTTIFLDPFGMCSDIFGNLYIADAGHNCIKKIDQNRKISIYAGNGMQGSKNGNAIDAQFDFPSGVCSDKSGNLFIAGFGGQTIRKISNQGEVTTIAGNGEDGYVDGQANQSKFSSPRGICIDSKGNLYIGDCWNHRIRKITPDGIVSTFAGGGKRGELIKNAWKDGTDTSARFDAPCGMAIDDNDNIYIADANNDCIRKITQDGVVSTLAGISGLRAHQDGSYGVSVLNCPTELVVNHDGTIFFSDTYGNYIRKIDTLGIVSTVVGNGNKGMKNDKLLDSELNTPRGITIIGDTIFFIEMINRTIRCFKPE